ncbi:MAG: hypothetical protein ACYS8W_19500 [Planctomycetota bacterium]|jgi:hypothetical protein
MMRRWKLNLTVLVLVAVSVFLCGQVPVAGDDEKADGTDSIVEIPPFEGSKDGALAAAIADYEKGRLGSAETKAEAVAEDGEASEEDRAGAKKLIAIIGDIGKKRLAAAEDAFKNEAYADAHEIWSITQNQFGASHPVGAEAKKRISRLLSDSTTRDRYKAQQLIKTAEEKEAEGKTATARLKLKNVINSYADTPEAKKAQEMLARLGGTATPKAVSSSGKNSKNFPFGTVTKSERIPGDMDCKGNARRLDRGGYMKFNLSGYEQGKVIRSATLKVWVESVSKNPWLWVCSLSKDPTTTSVEEVFNEIQAHSNIISGAMKIRAGQWATIPLNRKASSAIQKALNEGKAKDRWFALSLTFE